MKMHLNYITEHLENIRVTLIIHDPCVIGHQRVITTLTKTRSILLYFKTTHLLIGQSQIKTH